MKEKLRNKKDQLSDSQSHLIGVLERENRENVKEEINEELAKQSFSEKEDIHVGIHQVPSRTNEKQNLHLDPSL